MDKTRLQIRPGFFAGVWFVCVVIPWLVGGFLAKPRLSDQTRAQTTLTYSEIKSIAEALKRAPASQGSSASRDGNLVLQSLGGAAAPFNSFDTNRQGELLDAWKTPYKIKSTPASNCIIISSAGRDRIWGTKDDIVFNSVSNDFVDP